MAVVSPVVPVIARRVVDRSSSSSCRVRGVGLMEGRGEIVEEEAVEEETWCVAVGKDVNESRSTLIWALQNSGGKKICLLHVLVPSATIPMSMGAEFPESSAEPQMVRAHREAERENMHKLLNNYQHICCKMGVQPKKLSIESESVENGILQLIQRHRIKKLVMGAAPNKRYKRNMTELKSKKAISVRNLAPASCLIYFICNDFLIHKREGSADRPAASVSSSPIQPILIPDVEQPNLSRSASTPLLRRNNTVKLTNPVQDIFNRAFSSNANRNAGRVSISSSPNSPVDREACINELEVVVRSPSQSSTFSSFSSGGVPDRPSTPVQRSAGSIHVHDDSYLTSSSVVDGSVDESFLDQLEQAISEAENAKREAFQEAVRRGKAEKDVIEYVRKLKSLETLCAEEHRRREEVEESLMKEEKELGRIRNQLEVGKEELRVALDQKSQLEKKIKETDEFVRELEQKIMSAVGLLQTYREERDELQLERDNALREAEELRRRQGDISGTTMLHYYSEFTFSEIVEATQNFDSSLKIGEGGYGSIFKGSIRYTTVAIKVLRPDSSQGPQEFQQEVDVLSKVRHPNLVTLIGACPEAFALVYEYLPNGSLEDRLNCQDNTTPLSWQTRVRIATELCSALVFLHSSSPQSIVHGDLKPSNVLLDAHLLSKLGDFGICRLISRNESSSNSTTLIHRTDNLRGTRPYIDPEFLSSGELSPKSDIYSFGVILLRLLTGRPAVGIIREVQYAIESGNLKSLLDPLAGDWPYVQAEQLAHLALRCCELNRKNRPDLGTDVWRVLEPMRASCGGFSSFRMGSEEQRQPPRYFICPILQEVMQDPHVAADGYTYEAEALRGWLESGHDSSPMTNLPLAHHNLVPNRALRTAIQEWLQNH